MLLSTYSCTAGSQMNRGTGMRRKNIFGIKIAWRRKSMAHRVVGILSHLPNPPPNKTGFIWLYVKIVEHLLKKIFNIRWYVFYLKEVVIFFRMSYTHNLGHWSINCLECDKILYNIIVERRKDQYIGKLGVFSLYILYAVKCYQLLINIEFSFCAFQKLF